MKTLSWMKQSKLTELHTDVAQNLDRYRSGDFHDLIDPDWKQKPLLNYEDDVFTALTGSSKTDLDDSLILHHALRGLPARLATHMNVWVPLIHTELLDYTRKRWLDLDGTDTQLINSINTHIFRGGTGGYRDDNAAGRLWWTGYIGSLIAGTSEMNELRRVLLPFMRTTDTRSNVIERSGIFTERGLAKQISEYLNDNRLENAGNENVFRSFMISINLRSNGRYFGDMRRPEVFDFLDQCR